MTLRGAPIAMPHRLPPPIRITPRAAAALAARTSGRVPLVLTVPLASSVPASVRVLPESHAVGRHGWTTVARVCGVPVLASAAQLAMLRARHLVIDLDPRGTSFQLRNAADTPNLGTALRALP